MDASLSDTRMKMLGEFAEMTLVLARDLQQAALAADEPEDKVRLATAFHRLGRGLRQSLALQARLERDAQRDAHEAEARAVDLADARRRRRKAQVKGAVERLIWTEHEQLEDPEDLIDQLDCLLDAEAETEDFEREQPDLVIARLCEVLGLSPTDPPPQGEVAEGRRGLQPTHAGHPAFQPPRSVPDSSPCGGASVQPPFHPSG